MLTPTGRARREPNWGRTKLIALLAGATVGAVLLLTGLGLAAYYTLHPGSTHTTAAAHHAAGHRPGSAAPDTAAGPQAAQNALANRAMPQVDPAAAQPGPVSPRDPGDILLPLSTSIGPVHVPSGFPHTPAGALGQLAAIDQTALQSGSLDGARAVIASWAAPGGPTPSTWSGVAALAEFYSAAGLSGGGSAQLALVITPLMGLVKGSVGPDFTVVCVDFEADATLNQTTRVAVADCQRMAWRTSRWVIGAGREPAQAPSVWPDTDTAIAVGWKDLRHA